MSARLIDQFETLIRRDPARRGLIGADDHWGMLCPGHLSAAAADLAAFARRVAIVTGFYIPRGEPVSAETDGPLGAALLAAALREVEIDACLVTDQNCASAVRAAAEANGLTTDDVWSAPLDRESWVDGFFSDGPGHGLTHLIAIERVGPSHTPESLQQQPRKGPVPLAEFQSKVSPDDFNHCHNMRGERIDAWTGAMHQLFEKRPDTPPGMKTVGIGDGGNEIGMGCIPWEELARRLEGEIGAKIPCRIATDWNIISGTSNWGGYALAAAVLLLRGETERLRPFDREQQRHALEYLVEHGPAVDGVTRRREATVDGLPFLTYIQPWEGIRRLLDFDG
ncbi:MAG TPA: glutamate cyclase domain-containing protein [Planctomycetaceae bacterium]|nr:glutamate cyclase domain-containing protein [Planctomycetaceae bacterium]